MTEIQNGFLKEIMGKMYNLDDSDLKKKAELIQIFDIEFKHGKFLAPFIESEQDYILVSYDTDEGNLFPLFTDSTEIGEFSKYKITNMTYIDYVPMLDDESFHGFIINPFSCKFFLSKDAYLAILLENVDLIIPKEKKLNKNELKQAKKNMDNKEIINFIKKSSKIEDLFDKIGRSYLLTIVSNEKKFKNKIVKNNNFSLLKTKDLYILIFTNEKDLITESKKHKGNLYSQLINLVPLVHFILNEDLSGIILDKGTDHELKITRDDLIKNLKQIEKKCYNTKLDDSVNYGFKI